MVVADGLDCLSVVVKTTCNNRLPDHYDSKHYESGSWLFLFINFNQTVNTLRTSRSDNVFLRVVTV
jgi:hypothetical protein